MDRFEIRLNGISFPLTFYLNVRREIYRVFSSSGFRLLHKFVVTIKRRILRYKSRNKERLIEIKLLRKEYEVTYIKLF